jgi:hypothetical protein
MSRRQEALDEAVKLIGRNLWREMVRPASVKGFPGGLLFQNLEKLG